jgi:hypothetical protein
VPLLITWASRTMKAEAGGGVELSALSGALTPVSSARLPAIPVCPQGVFPSGGSSESKIAPTYQAVKSKNLHRCIPFQ